MCREIGLQGIGVQRHLFPIEQQLVWHLRSGVRALSERAGRQQNQDQVLHNQRQ